MSNTLSFAKRVLENVCFDKNLFYKEFQKASKYLLPYDLEQLYYWVKDFVKTKPELDTLALEISI
ncbi:hypothetical protein QW060_03415 [Myroides ceti]|uniref:Uncharacterized protein n=1 Tax=Paenimyroides ceti TaxID=395087 RepID=A0ABT8CPN7_9FLAO|nr:hypothetical protein [Paenimyroides ceti]MDN3706170.1 hypothetical protein [Paenimyroides ceti]